VGGDFPNWSCTVVMDEGRLKYKRLSYTAEFKREVIRCAEENGNRKAAAIFGVDESNVRLWRKHKATISGCEASRRKFTGPNYYIIIINNKIIDYCIVLFLRCLLITLLLYCTAVQSFFQNPALDRESNPHLIF
jgi:hypothetical protein